MKKKILSIFLCLILIVLFLNFSFISFVFAEETTRINMSSTRYVTLSTVSDNTYTLDSFNNSLNRDMTTYYSSNFFVLDYEVELIPNSNLPEFDSTKYMPLFQYAVYLDLTNFPNQDSFNNFVITYFSQPFSCDWQEICFELFDCDIQAYILFNLDSYYYRPSWSSGGCEIIFNCYFKYDDLMLINDYTSVSSFDVLTKKIIGKYNTKLLSPDNEVYGATSFNCPLMQTRMNGFDYTDLNASGGITWVWVTACWQHNIPVDPTWIYQIDYTNFQTSLNIKYNYGVSNKYNFDTIQFGLNGFVLNSSYSSYYSSFTMSLLNHLTINFSTDNNTIFYLNNLSGFKMYNATLNDNTNVYFSNLYLDNNWNSWVGILNKFPTSYNYYVSGFNFWWDGVNAGNSNPYLVVGGSANSGNSLSSGLYRSDVAWYDIFGHLYNFLIYLLFDFPLLKEFNTAIYYLFDSIVEVINIGNDWLIGLGVFGACLMGGLLFKIVSRFV